MTVLKVLFFSDIHDEQDPESVSFVRDAIENERPTIVLLGGDYTSISALKSIAEKALEVNARVYYILGNNDEFAKTWHEYENVVATLKEFEAHPLKAIFEPRGNVLMMGISGNLRLRLARSIPIGKRPEDYLKEAETLKQTADHCGNCLKILVLHDVPTEICQEVAKRVQGFRFNEYISGTVTEAIEKIRPNIVLHGHLHLASGLVVQKSLGDRTCYICCTCVLSVRRGEVNEERGRRYVAIDVEKEKIVVRIVGPEGTNTILLRR